VHYRNCFEALRAGALPLFEGEPGYSRRLDDDGDGQACEPGEGF
jgi:Excalibur calcium-binding domain